MRRNDQVDIVQCDWQEISHSLELIRTKVFIEEQGVPIHIEMDGLDSTAWHFLASTAAGETIGCSRLLPSGKIGRLAVLRSYRGEGVGTALLKETVRFGTAALKSKLYLHAQSYAKDFYEANGFSSIGAPFLEADIEHIKMIYNQLAN